MEPKSRLLTLSFRVEREADRKIGGKWLVGRSRGVRQWRTTCAAATKVAGGEIVQVRPGSRGDQ
jgi:hypothetical protein